MSCCKARPVRRKGISLFVVAVLIFCSCCQWLQHHDVCVCVCVCVCLCVCEIENFQTNKYRINIYKPHPPTSPGHRPHKNSQTPTHCVSHLLSLHRDHHCQSELLHSKLTPSSPTETGRRLSLDTITGDLSDTRTRFHTHTLRSHF